MKTREERRLEEFTRIFREKFGRHPTNNELRAACEAYLDYIEGYCEEQGEMRNLQNDFFIGYYPN